MEQDVPKANGRIVPNQGVMGVESIRIGGMTLNTLPMAEAAITKQQWSEVEANAKRQEIEDILGDYPKARISYLRSRITECEENITRIRTLVSQQNAMINEYSAHIGLCAHRDKEIAKLDPEKDIEAIKALKRQFPPYDVDAMKQQIVQCDEAINRSEEVIKQEFDSISELKEVIVKCRERDQKLASYGVTVE